MSKSPTSDERPKAKVIDLMAALKAEPEEIGRSARAQDCTQVQPEATARPGT